MYIDSHAHLEGPKFDSDRLQMLERAQAAGLERILAIGSGTGPGTFDWAIRIAEQHDWIYATPGMTPFRCCTSTGTLQDWAESCTALPANGNRPNLLLIWASTFPLQAMSASPRLKTYASRQERLRPTES